MNEQLPSDLLSRLKRYAEQNAREPWIPVKAAELMALVECAEVLRELRWTPVGDQSKSDIDAFWARVHAAVDKLEAL